MCMRSMKSSIDFQPVMCLCILDKNVRDKHIAVYNFAGITGKSFSKAFTKHNTEKVFNVIGIYLNYIFMAFKE